jgi:hypothetical protein
MSNNHEVIQNQPKKLIAKAKLSAVDQLELEQQLMAKGWRWIKDVTTRSHKLVAPVQN